MLQATTKSPSSDTEDRIFHIAPPPYERSYCGIDRGDLPLRPDISPREAEMCVVCREMTSNRGLK